MTKRRSSKLLKAGLLGVALGYFLFGSKNKESRDKVKDWSRKAKGEILEHIDDLEHVVEEKYDKIVDKVVRKYAAKAGIDPEDIEKFEKEARRYWSKIEKGLKERVSTDEPAPKKTQATRKKSVKKKAAPKKKIISTKTKRTAKK